MHKRFPLLALLALLPSVAFAANPSFSSFDQTYFTTNSLIISLRPNAIGDSLWTNSAGVYLPTATNAAALAFGRHATNWWAPGPSDGFISIHDSSIGESGFNSWAIGAIDGLLQENYSIFQGLVSSGDPNTYMRLLSATNFQNPSAPISKFEVGLDASTGEVQLQLLNNGTMNFSVSNQVTSVQALSLTPLVTTIALGPNCINVQSNGCINLLSPSADPSNAEVDLTTGLRDGMPLILRNLSTNAGFTLFNGSPLCDDATKYVTLINGNWVTTNKGDGILLIGGIDGWSEVGRFNQNTNVSTADLWYMDSGSIYRPTLAQQGLVANNIASGQSLTTYGALTMLPYTNNVVNGTNQIPLTTKGSVKLISANSDPTAVILSLGTPASDSSLIVLQNAASSSGFTLPNGSALYNNPTAHVTLQNGNWVSTNLGDGILLVGGPDGVQEIGRFSQNTNAMPFNLIIVTNYSLANGTNITISTATAGTNVTFTINSSFAPLVQVDANNIKTDGNIGAALAVGNTSYIDLDHASRTNLVSGAMTFLYATNGLDLVEKTQVRWLFNNSGSDQTLTVPAEWRTNAFSPVPTKLTNGWITAMYCKCLGQTSSSTLQSNVFLSFEYYH